MTSFAKRILNSPFIRFFSQSKPVMGPLNDPIIVYQMGKVGSRSVFQTIQDLNPQSQLYHAHVLHDLDVMEENMKKELENPGDTLGVIRQGRDLRKKIDHDPNMRWSIITLVRDPIKQTISRFFQGIEEVIPSIQERYKANTIEVEELIEVFFKKWPFHPPLMWFDTQFKPVFDIDIYQHPFPWDKGYMILKKNRFDVLVIRLEDLNNCAEQAFFDFFNTPDITLKKENVAANKWYQDLYSNFIKRIVFPEEYLTNLYDSKFTKHFYSPAEIEQFYKNWQQ